jgi:hypothetical protein
MSDASMALIGEFNDTEVKTYETPSDSVTVRQFEDVLVGAKATVKLIAK